MILPELELKGMLEHNVVVEYTDTAECVAVYRQGERPNTDVPDNFIEIYQNGVIRSVTTGFGVLEGVLAVAIYCKSNSDGTVKLNRMYSMLKQVKDAVADKAGEKYFFSVSRDNIMTAPTANSSSGYSMMMLNIEWHTRQENIK